MDLMIAIIASPELRRLRIALALMVVAVGLTGSAHAQPSTRLPTAAVGLAGQFPGAKDTARVRTEIERLRPASAVLAEQMKTKTAAKLGGLASYNQKADELNNAMRVQTCMSNKAFSGMLKDGYFKIYNEVSRNRGDMWVNDMYRQLRSKMESNFGLSDERVIYGALAHDKASGTRLNIYGEIAVVLRQSKIKDRTTFTCYDTLNAFQHGKVDKSQYESSLCTMEHAAHMILAHDQGTIPRGEYIEAQIRGGATLDDIAAVEIPADVKFDELARQAALRLPNAKIVRGKASWETGR